MTPPPDRDELFRRARYYRVRRRFPRVLVMGFWALWLGVAIVAGTVLSGYTFVEQTIAEISPNTTKVVRARKVVDRVTPGAPQNILLLGSDKRPDEANGRSDTMILVRIDSQRRFISMLRFARDLWVTIPGVGQDRINAAYTYGEQSNGSGPAKVIETVKALTGQEVNGYFEINFKGFEQLVDKLGGVYIDVDRRYFNDNSGSDKYEMIDLKPGYQLLSGADALDYVRYRHTDTDFARGVRQQSFLTELKRRTRGQLSQAPRFVKLIADRKNTSTDIDDAGRLLTLARQSIDIPDSRVFRVQVDGSPYKNAAGAWVNQFSETEMQDALDQWLNPPFLAKEDIPTVTPATVTIEVLNGSGRTLVGQQMASLLSSKGYRATSMGNAQTFDYTSSTVRFVGSNEKSFTAARKIRQLLGPSASLEQVQPRDLAGNDVAVIVGTDFTGSLSTPAPEQREQEAPADTVDTARLVPIVRGLSKVTGMNLAVPLKIARGSSLKQIRNYRIPVGGGRSAPAVKLVFQRQDGGNQYWGIMATSMSDPPILEGQTGTLKKGRGLAPLSTFYNGKFLMRESFQYRGVSYWLTNSLEKDHALSANTMHEIARSFRPAGSARLPRGAQDVGLSVEYDASTP
ncbi:MAG: LCP family protein [Thermoleophilia bacterium]